jgi:DNA-binding GntR family transcriptional regulator
LKLKIPANPTQRAYKTIHDDILKGTIDGQQHFTEAFFAERYGISKSPIREALDRLEAEGLITIIPRRGAFVREFAVHDAEEIYELREVLETLVVRNAVLDAKTLARLREIVSAAQSFLEKNDKSSYIRTDAAFHTTLAMASSNSRLRRMLESMHNQMLLLRRQTFELSSHLSVKQHLGILNALEKGQRQVAAKLMAQHIRAVRKTLIDHLKSQKKQRTKASR